MDELSELLAADEEQLKQLWSLSLPLTLVGKQFVFNPAVPDEVYRQDHEPAE
jgi:hypothetical protein